MLQLKNISVAYGEFRALNNIDLHVDQGELVVLLGANGAGKSTIFKAISGLVKPVEGSIQFNSEELAGKKPSYIVERGLVQCPEGRKLFPGMSVRKNLLLGAYVHRRDKEGMQRSLKEVYELFPILEQKADDAAGSLSGGQQQMVAIGRALMSRPKMLLLDEPSLGLAPLVVKQMFEVIQKINEQGTSVLLAEQNAFAALKVADRAYVIESGRIVMQGDRETLMNDERVRKAYIGG